MQFVHKLYEEALRQADALDTLFNEGKTIGRLHPWNDYIVIALIDKLHKSANVDYSQGLEFD